MLLLGRKRQTSKQQPFSKQQTTKQQTAALNVICTAQNHNSIERFFLFFSSTQAHVYLRDNNSDNQRPAPK